MMSELQDNYNLSLLSYEGNLEKTDSLRCQGYHSQRKQKCNGKISHPFSFTSKSVQFCILFEYFQTLKKFSHELLACLHVLIKYAPVV